MTAEPSRVEDTIHDDDIAAWLNWLRGGSYPLHQEDLKACLKDVADLIRRLAAAKASAERERDSMDLSYAPVLARALAAEAKLREARGVALGEAIEIATAHAAKMEKIGKEHPEEDSRDRLFARAREAVQIADDIIALRDRALSNPE